MPGKSSGGSRNPPVRSSLKGSRSSLAALAASSSPTPTPTPTPIIQPTLSGEPGGTGFSDIYKQFQNRLNTAITGLGNINIDPTQTQNYLLNQFRKKDTGWREGARRKLLGAGYSPTSLAFKREMERAQRGEEGDIYDVIGKMKMAVPGFELQKSNLLSTLLGKDVGMSGIASNYLKDIAGLSLQDLWARSNRGDYMNMLSGVFGLDPWKDINPGSAWGG